MKITTKQITFAGILAAVIVTLCTEKPSKEVEELFDKAEKTAEARYETLTERAK